MNSISSSAIVRAKVGRQKDQESIQPHLTRDTIWESDKTTSKHQPQESQEVNPFTASDQKAARKRPKTDLQSKEVRLFTLSDHKAARKSPKTDLQSQEVSPFTAGDNKTARKRPKTDLQCQT